MNLVRPVPASLHMVHFFVDYLNERSAALEENANFVMPIHVNISLYVKLFSPYDALKE
jgi:hypothetical protein